MQRAAAAPARRTGTGSRGLHGRQSEATAGPKPLRVRGPPTPPPPAEAAGTGTGTRVGAQPARRRCCATRGWRGWTGGSGGCCSETRAAAARPQRLQASAAASSVQCMLGEKRLTSGPATACSLRRTDRQLRRLVHPDLFAPPKGGRRGSLPAVGRRARNSLAPRAAVCRARDAAHFRHSHVTRLRRMFETSRAGSDDCTSASPPTHGGGEGEAGATFTGQSARA